MKQVAKRTIAEGKWLKLAEIDYIGHDNKIRKWEMVERANTNGAVCIFATVKQTGEMVLIRQTRPPVNGYVIEIPAGLVDPGEDPRETAVRELREETGYKGELIWISAPAYSSPGLSNECLYFAKMEIDLNKQDEIKTDFDDSECIETIFVHPEKLTEFLQQRIDAGDAVDAKVMTYAMSVAQGPAPSEPSPTNRD